MALSLAKICATLGTKEITLPGGRKVTVRALRASELDAIADAIPRPAPPLGKNPLQGSDAPPIPRDDDANYQKRSRRWYSDLRTAEACVAIDLECPLADAAYTFLTTPDDKRDEWLRLAVRELRKVVPEPEIRLILETMDSLSTRDMVRESIKVLFVERDGEPKLSENEIRLPEKYDLTESGILMAAAARFHVGDPFAWVDGLDPAKRAIIIATEIAKMRDESEMKHLLLAAVGIASAC